MNPSTNIILFKSIQIVNREFNLCFSRYVLPIFQLLLISLPTFCNYLLICHHGSLGIPAIGAIICLDGTCFAIVSIAFPLGASIYVHSNRYLNLFSKISGLNGHGSEVRKTIKSFTPLKVKFANFYYIRKFTVLKTFGLIIYWTMKALLIFETHD